MCTLCYNLITCELSCACTYTPRAHTFANAPHVPQFRIDVAVNPNDTEEAIWAFISEKKLGQSVAKPLLRVGRDTRAVMRSAYALFESGQESATEALAAYARACTPAGDSNSNSLHDEFYAQLYLGLHAESQGHAAKARAHITAATGTAYGRESKDYMVALARVHMQVRGWTE